jgi:N-acetylglucosaminyldiphosphoundecaprenol N-acetyl-beta-D-mannosaminyltransferase
MNVEKGLSDHGFHTIEEVNMDTLMMAENDAVIRAALEAVEHTVIAEAGILEAVGAVTYQRKREIEHRDFFYELMKRIERNHKTLFLIGDGAKQTRQMCEQVQELYPHCAIVGTEALEECEGATDNVVNEMNSLAPDVIISILPSPKQEHFLMENRDKLSAGLWYGIGEASLGKKKSRIGDALRNLIRTHKLEKQVHQYHDSNA